MDGLALTFPVTFVACDVEQILVGIHVVLTYDLCCIGNYFFWNTYLASYFNSKATTGVPYLKLEKSFHAVSVVKHGSVHYARGVFCKMLQILIMGGDDTIGPLLDKTA